MSSRWLCEDQQFLLVEYTGDGVTSWDAYDRGIDEAWGLAEQSTTDVIVIFAAYNSPMPVGDPLPHLRRALQTRPRNVSSVIGIVSSRYESTVMSMFVRLAGVRGMRVVASWAAANHVLQSSGLPRVPTSLIPPVPSAS
ncbi:MAG: hypothetical protein AAF125_03990 [Chloroflexota bacterium]